MAPPSFGPPGYAIPDRYRHRTPPPEGADTNTKPYLIIFAYLVVCISIIAFITNRIVRRYFLVKKIDPTTRFDREIFLFGSLAVTSLLTAWTFLFKYLQVSYQTWLMWRSYYELDSSHRHLGLWLKETSLFQELWEIAIIGNARYWWTHQIFFFALGLGLYLDQQGLRRGIKYTWAFMLLGQMVSISFATNLLFLTLLRTSPITTSAASDSAKQHPWFRPRLLNFGAVFGTTIPAFLLASEHYWHHPTDFLPVIATPHIALLVLPACRAILPARILGVEDHLNKDKAYGFLWALTLFNAALMLCKATWTAYSYAGFTGIRNALLEHPVVSGIAFDVILCWTSWSCWLVAQRRQHHSVAKIGYSALAESPEADSAGVAIKHHDLDSGMRHR